MSILLKDTGLEALQSRIVTEPHRAIYAAMNARWREAAAEEIGADRIAYRFACGSSYVTPGLVEAALAARLTGGPEALAHVVRQIDKIDRIYSDPPRSLKEHVAGRTTYFSNVELCLAWSLCQEMLPAEKSEAVLRLARDYFLSDYAGIDMTRAVGIGHNIHLTKRVSAGIIALALGDAAGRADWAEVAAMAADAVRLFCRWGFDPHGVSQEAVLYGLAASRWIYPFVELYRPHEDLLVSLPTLSQIPQALVEMSLPDGRSVPAFDDSTFPGPRLAEPWLLLTGRRLDRPQDLALWWQSGGPAQAHWQSLLWWDGCEPPSLQDLNLPRSFAAPGAGVAVMRSAWSDQAVHVTALSQGRSHSAPSHGHADAGHFSIYAFGEHLAVDPGYWNLNEDQHSVVLVDGVGHVVCDEGWFGMQPFAGRMPQHEDAGWLDYVKVEAAAAKACIWADRHFLFVRGQGEESYLVVLDNINKNNDAFTLLWQLQAHPDRRIEVDDDRHARLIGERGRLDLSFFNPLAEDYAERAPALSLRQDMKRGAEPESQRKSRPRLLAEQTGLAGRLMTIVSPRRIEAPPLVVREQTGCRTFRAEVELESFTDTIIASLDRAWIDFEDVKGLTELAVIRRDRDGRVVRTWTVDGAKLTLGSRQTSRQALSPT